MAQVIEFHFDFPSPYTYLATTQFPALVARTGAEIVYRPFRVLGLMKLVGNRPTTLECKNKGRYAMTDVGRWAARYGVPVGRHPNMRSFDFGLLAQGALVADDEGRAAEYVRGVYRAVWGEPADLSDRSTLTALLDRMGFDGAGLLERAAAPETIERLDKATEAAAERGVFGTPTFFVGDAMFFGNDRLDFLAETLKAAA